MQKTILITGATDGIGLETAKMLAAKGHHILLHGRNPTKLADVEHTLAGIPGAAGSECHIADFSNLADVARLADDITQKHKRLDVLINNAGVFKTGAPITAEGMDVRFVVNTLAPVSAASACCR